MARYWKKMPALVGCDFHDMAYNEILGDVDDTRRFVHKFQQPDAKVLKEHCDLRTTSNTKIFASQ